MTSDRFAPPKGNPPGVQGGCGPLGNPPPGVAWAEAAFSDLLNESGRKRKREAASLARRAAHPDAAAVQLQQLAYDGQSETSAFLVGRA
jgi:hypothetical protein